MEEEKKWCVYKHTSPSGKVYIGITCQSVNRRWRRNGKGYDQDSQKKFRNAIKKYGWQNFQHEIIEDNINSLELANEKERYWISFYDSYRNGYNSTLGGDASGTKKHSKEFIEFLKKQKYNCRSVTADGIIYKSLKECAEYYDVPPGRMRSWLDKKANMPKEFVELNLHYTDNPNITYIQSTGHGKKRGKHNCAKKVLCDDIVFECLEDCADYYNINSRTMSKWLCTHSMPQEFFNKKLHYVGENDENSIMQDKRKEVLQFDQENFKLVKRWSSVTEAADYYKCSKANICNVLQRKNKTACGYIWRYKNDCGDILDKTFKKSDIKCGAESHNAVKINQYKTDGTFIKTWGCINEAAIYYNVKNKSISCVLDEKLHRRCKGFQWRRYDEFKDCCDIEAWKDNYTSSHSMKKVIQYDLKNNFIFEYHSVKEATKETKVGSSCISSCCRGEQKTAGGFIWKYADEVENNTLETI